MASAHTHMRILKKHTNSALSKHTPNTQNSEQGEGALTLRMPSAGLTLGLILPSKPRLHTHTQTHTHMGKQEEEEGAAHARFYRHRGQHGGRAGGAPNSHRP